MTQPTEGQSVLAMMRKGVEDISKKKDKAAGLQPTPTEAALQRIPDVPGDFLTNEGLADKARDLRTMAAYLITVAEGLEKMTGTEPVATKADLTAEVKAAEKAADEKHRADARPTDFSERLKQQQAEAQASVFDKPHITTDEAIAWTCPDHGAAGITKTSPKGRQYTGCPVDGCRQLER